MEPLMDFLHENWEYLAGIAVVIGVFIAKLYGDRCFNQLSQFASRYHIELQHGLPLEDQQRLAKFNFDSHRPVQHSVLSLISEDEHCRITLFEHVSKQLDDRVYHRRRNPEFKTTLTLIHIPSTWPPRFSIIRSNAMNALTASQVDVSFAPDFARKYIVLGSSTEKIREFLSGPIRQTFELFRFQKIHFFRDTILIEHFRGGVTAADAQQIFNAAMILVQVILESDLPSASVPDALEAPVAAPFVPIVSSGLNSPSAPSASLPPS